MMRPSPQFSEVYRFSDDPVCRGRQGKGMAENQHEGRLKGKDQQGAVPQSVAPRGGDRFNSGAHK